MPNHRISQPMPGGDSHGRPWYKLHTTTLIAVAVVTAALAYSHLHLRGLFSVGGTWSTTACHYQGWPVTCRHLTVIESSDFDPTTGKYTGTTRETASRWLVPGLAVNIAVSLILIVATAVVCERWRRRQCRPWQFGLQSLLMAVTTSGILLVLYRNEVSLYWWWAGVVDDAVDVLFGGFRFLPWYASGPLLFGIGCAIALFLSLGAAAVSSVIASVGSTVATQSEADK